jgi:hypothetical protein
VSKQVWVATVYSHERSELRPAKRETLARLAAGRPAAHRRRRGSSRASVSNGACSSQRSGSTRRVNALSSPPRARAGRARTRCAQRFTGSPTSPPCATARPAWWSALARSRAVSSATAPRPRSRRHSASSPRCFPGGHTGFGEDPDRFDTRLRGPRGDLSNGAGAARSSHGTTPADRGWPVTASSDAAYSAARPTASRVRR